MTNDEKRRLFLAAVTALWYHLLRQEEEACLRKQEEFSLGINRDTDKDSQLFI